MEVSRLSPHHAPEYRALMLEAYAAHPDAFTSSVAERAALPLSWWEKRLWDAPDSSQAVFGLFDGQLAGAVGLSSDTREKANHKATLFGMYIRTAFRGQGHGHLLVKAALDHARTRPRLTVVQLTVTEGNLGAETLYAKHGFVRFGLEPYAVAVGSQYVSKVHMWCDLS